MKADPELRPPDRRKKRDPLEEIAKQIRETIEDEDYNPAYHRMVMRRHRREWPGLWYYLDKLLLELDKR